jgi:guanylate kinase
MKKKKVFILSWPAWVGKNTLWDWIRKDCENFLEESTSATSRSPRAGEVNGREYHFLSRGEFEKQIHEHAFLEYAIVHTNYYGSPKSELERITKKGKTPIYIIEPQWMTHIKPILEEMGYEVVTIFLLPPSLDELKRRIKNRWTETEEQFQIRLATAMTEFEQQDFYDIRIVNDDIEKTKKELIAILKM